ncbi:hypothetical protein QBC42DRAFT_229112 [Cladorrhinum samala]|uniref:HD domain-containing protein n=1 Tax=Cladorrhinum samala TaxID=585594 RepID=A0AAV9HJZ3_9PEZI|nr:hypothetical protein QBC42DRAFT_229112 [Cladorrhinum samala]
MRLRTLSSAFLPLLLDISSHFSLTTAAPSPQAPSHGPPPPDPSFLPHRILAGISVVDTPIVRDAEAYAKRYSPGSYNHIMRSWLWGVLHLRHNATLASQVDLEVHAVGLMLHDIASDHNLSHPFVSPDRRFEVDSAIAAADFIRSHPDGKKWPDWRVQRVWDGIALHAEPKLALYKEPDVFAIYWGNELEWSYGKPAGERKGITEEEREAVMKEFPNEGGLDEGPSTGLLWFVAWYCKYKPESTYALWGHGAGLFAGGTSAV